MPLKLMASWRTLMLYAGDLGKAEQSKDTDPETYTAAKKRHDEYRELCLRDDVEVFDATN